MTRINVIDTRLSFGTLTPLARRSVDYLVIHTEGSPRNTDGSAASIHEYHKRPRSQRGRGWAGIGYHFVVRKDGRVELGRPLHRQGAHVHGYNAASIGLCCSGNGDLTDFTVAQKASLSALVSDLRVEFPSARIDGHRPMVDRLVRTGVMDRKFSTNKTCPGLRVSMYELEQLVGTVAGYRPQPGDRRWSDFYQDWITLVRYVSDTEWYFLRDAQPAAAPRRGGARWTQMPMTPAMTLSLAATAFSASLSLPDLDTDPGIMGHMMIAESINPGNSSYDHAVVEQGLRAMKSVVVNRLKEPHRFNAPGARTWKEIITAPGQWHGFSLDASGKVRLIDALIRRIDEVLRRANDGVPGRYHQFVTTVLATTNSAVTDPFAELSNIGNVAVTGGSYGWRTSGSSAPGGAFIAVPTSLGGVIAGNQFYTLRK